MTPDFKDGGKRRIGGSFEKLHKFLGVKNIKILLHRCGGKVKLSKMFEAQMRGGKI